MALINLVKTYPSLIENIYQKYKKTFTNPYYVPSKLSMRFFDELDSHLKLFNSKVARSVSRQYIWVEFDTESDLTNFILMC
jgi:hypothetical protein